MPDANLTALFQDFGGLNLTLAPLVYTRARWADEWEYRPYLRCNWAQWTIQPGTSQAEIQWNYGPVQMHDMRQKETLLPDDGSRRYVKIEFPNNSYTIGETVEPIFWYGMVFGMGTDQGAVADSLTDGSLYETGAQSIQCVGLEKLLEDTVVCNSAWTDSEGEMWRVDRGLTFNDYRADGTIGGNMSSVGFEGIPTFSGRILDDDASWTATYILKYLLKHHRPADKNGIPIPFGLLVDGVWSDVLATIPDRPHLPTHGRNVRDLINQLVSPDRFVAWTLEVDETFNAVFIKLVPITGDPILLPSGALVQANNRRWTFNIDHARTASAITLSHADAVERVRVQGARATSTFTISNADGTLEEGYTTTQKSSYDSGGSGKPGYAGATNNLKKKLNKWARARDDMKFVYSRFKIPHDWDGTAGDGEGGDGGHFCPIDTATLRFKFNPREFELEPQLAMRDGYNYDDLGGAADPTPPTKSGDGPFNHRPPIVLIRWPAEGMDASDLASIPRWLFIDQVGKMAEEDTAVSDPETSWSGHVDIPKKDRAIVIKVTGEDQYVIAGADYTQISGIETLKYLWDWKTIIATVTAKWDAHCEGVWPRFKADTSNADHIREAVFDAGDEYRLDWLVPNTVIGISTATGGLQRSEDGGWIQNDKALLVDRARLAFLWYGVERRALQLSTSMINGSVQIGDFVVETGSLIPHAVNTVVTSIRIDCGPGNLGDSPPRPVQTYITDWIPDLDMFISPNLSPSRRPTLVAPIGIVKGIGKDISYPERPMMNDNDRIQQEVEGILKGNYPLM